MVCNTIDKPAKGLISIIKNLPRLLRDPLYSNSIYILANQLLAACTGLIFWALATHWYTTEDVGIGSAIISAATLLSYLALLGLDYTVIRFLSEEGSDKKALIDSSINLGGLASVIFSLIFIAGIKLWSPSLALLQDNLSHLLLFIICTTGWTCYWIAARVCIGLRRSKFTFFQGIIYNVTRLVLTIVMAASLAYFGLFLAFGIGGIVALIVCLFIFLPRIQPGYRFHLNIKLPVVLPLIRFATSNYLYTLLWSGTIYIIPLIVLNVLGEKENAYFYIGWQLANVLFAIPIASSFSLLAEGSHDQQKLGSNTRKSLIFNFAIVLPVVAVVIIFAYYILSIFGPVYAENSTSILRWAALSAIPISFNQIYFSFKRVEMKLSSVIIINSFTAIGTLVLSYILLHSLGTVGASIAWLSVHSTAALIVSLLWLRDNKRHHLSSQPQLIPLD